MDTLEEIATRFVNVFSKKSIYISNINILTSGWTLNNGLYEYTINNTNIKSNSFIDIIPDNSSIDIITSAKILPSISCQVGQCKIFSKNIPSSSFIVNMVISE